MTEPTLKQKLETIVTTLMQASQTGNQRLMQLAAVDFEAFMATVEILQLDLDKQKDDG